MPSDFYLSDDKPRPEDRIVRRALLVATALQIAALAGILFVVLMT
jgi:hypothetical protein